MSAVLTGFALGAFVGWALCDIHWMRRLDRLRRVAEQLERDLPDDASAAPEAPTRQD